jgi:hypothetical protein
MTDARDRKLTTQEIETLLHLLRAGAGGLRPVTMLSGARKRAAHLVRSGLVEIWFRQSIATSRTEGPFYCLSYRGREVAQAISFRRQARPHNPETRGEIVASNGRT